MAFACIYIPDFLVQSVVRGEPTLRDAPLALISGVPPLWSVVAANPSAFAAGIQLGMTKAQVEEFSSVRIGLRSESQEKIAHAALLDAAWSISPRVEDTAPDTLVLDLNGLASLFGPDEKIAQELVRRVSCIGLIPRMAVASNIEVAIHAARGFPGITLIPAGEERQCLGTLPVNVLATTPEVVEVLDRWGVYTFQALAELPVLQLSERLGQEGVRLNKLARGARQRSLVLAQSASHFEEEMELDEAVEELEPLSFVLGRLLDQLCARLEARALSIRAVHVLFELQPSFEKDFQTLKEDLRKKPETKQYYKVLTLPVPIRNAKTLLKLLRLQLQGDPPPAPIQKICMVAEPAAPRVTQNGLFVPIGPDAEKLELTIARLEKLVGEGNLGCAELTDSHRPESFRMERFVAAGERGKTRRTARKAPKRKSAETETGFLQELKPNRGESSTWGLTPSSPKETENQISKVVNGFRVVRPAEALRVELREEQPARVYLRGMRGEVMAASGPWRTSGDWWQEDAWQQDEWDLEIEFPPSSDVGAQHRYTPARQNRNPMEAEPLASHRGLYRIYFDTLRQGWFLRGIYD